MPSPLIEFKWLPNATRESLKSLAMTPSFELLTLSIKGEIPSSPVSAGLAPASMKTSMQASSM